VPRGCAMSTEMRLWKDCPLGGQYMSEHWDHPDNGCEMLEVSGIFVVGIPAASVVDVGHRWCPVDREVLPGGTDCEHGSVPCVVVVGVKGEQ
jgi:hypothetical protein